MIYNLAKRVIDIIGSLFGLSILSPLFLLVSMAIKLDSTGPLFADTPMRVGKDGKLFKMHKFRSMIANAHELLRTDPSFQALYEEYKKGSYKLYDDPRITRVGKFIRKYSLDELPQLLNVLKGEMSLVGPRAYYPDELEDQQIKYPSSRKYVKIILSGKPGITGVWQVSGRSQINFDKRVEMDAGYVMKRSILFDMILLIKTIPAVLSGKGAV
jgi:lipopolysaccharide/colanic/teichoic acid biosynthesis glycosyltransferase